MARSNGIIKTSAWTDPDFLALTKDAQRLYLLLISQPNITACGVLPYTPRRWAKLAADETFTSITDAVKKLAKHRFITVDEETDELLIRTFVKHDRIERLPALVHMAQRQFTETASDAIRALLVGERPKLFSEKALQNAGFSAVITRARADWRGRARTGADGRGLARTGADWRGRARTGAGSSPPPKEQEKEQEKKPTVRPSVGPGEDPREALLVRDLPREIGWQGADDRTGRTDEFSLTEEQDPVIARGIIRVAPGLERQ